MNESELVAHESLKALQDVALRIQLFSNCLTPQSLSTLSVAVNYVKY